LKRFRLTQRVCPFSKETARKIIPPRFLSTHRQEVDINPAIVLEPGSIIMETKRCNFFRETIIGSHDSAEGWRKTDWLSSTINQSEEETASDGEHA